jgi:hypothetical protein
MLISKVDQIKEGTIVYEACRFEDGYYTLSEPLTVTREPYEVVLPCSDYSLFFDVQNDGVTSDRSCRDFNVGVDNNYNNHRLYTTEEEAEEYIRS